MSNEPMYKEYECSDRLKRLATPRQKHRDDDDPTSPRRDPNMAPTLKLPQEDIDKRVERLHGTQRRPAKLKDLVEKRTLSKEEEERSIHRLYEQSIQTKEKKREALERKLAAPPAGAKETAKLDDVELGDCVSRMYEKAIMSSDNSKKALLKKYAAPVESHRLSRDNQESVNTRLFTESCQKKKSAQEKLYEKYVLDKQPKMAKRSVGEIRDTASRLNAKPDAV